MNACDIAPTQGTLLHKPHVKQLNNAHQNYLNEGLNLKGMDLYA